MKRYRARPIEIEALLWVGEYADVPQEWIDRKLIVRYDAATGALFTRTLQGPSRADVGAHYLIPNLQPQPDPNKDEVYPVSRAVFVRRYEEIEP